jgi:hypothetical protein
MQNIYALGLFESLQEGIFKFLLYVQIVKINDPWGGADFDPRAII